VDNNNDIIGVKEFRSVDATTYAFHSRRTESTEEQKAQACIKPIPVRANNLALPSIDCFGIELDAG
jgi:hypothetical protein